MEEQRNNHRFAMAQPISYEDSGGYYASLNGTLTHITSFHLYAQKDPNPRSTKVNSNRPGTPEGHVPASSPSSGFTSHKNHPETVSVSASVPFAQTMPSPVKVDNSLLVRHAPIPSPPHTVTLSFQGSYPLPQSELWAW